jgi:hypothetical protein
MRNLKVKRAGVSAKNRTEPFPNMNHTAYHDINPIPYMDYEYKSSGPTNIQRRSYEDISTVTDSCNGQKTYSELVFMYVSM